MREGSDPVPGTFLHLLRVYAVTRIPAVVLKAANAVYDVWARYRLPLTGRPDLAVVLREKQSASCRAGSAAAAGGEQQQERQPEQ